MLIRIDLDQFERDLDQEVRAWMLEFANELVNQLKIESPRGATGDLARSWQIFRQGDGVIWLGSRIHYAEDVWKGTEPHFADFDAIQVWARRVLGSEAAAGPVWRHIAQEGTEPNDYVGRALDSTFDRLA